MAEPIIGAEQENTVNEAQDKEKKEEQVPAETAEAAPELNVAEQEPKKSRFDFLRKAGEWIKEKVSSFVHALKEKFPVVGKEGGFLDRLETRVLGGKDAYNRLYTTDEPKEVLQRKENLVSTIVNNREQNAPDNPGIKVEGKFLIEANDFKQSYVAENKKMNDKTSGAKIDVISLESKNGLSKMKIPVHGDIKPENEIKAFADTLKNIEKRVTETNDLRSILTDRPYENKGLDKGVVYHEKFVTEMGDVKVKINEAENGKFHLSLSNESTGSSLEIRSSDSFNDSIYNAKECTAAYEQYSSSLDVVTNEVPPEEPEAPIEAVSENTVENETEKNEPVESHEAETPTADEPSQPEKPVNNTPVKTDEKIKKGDVIKNDKGHAFLVVATSISGDVLAKAAEYKADIQEWVVMNEGHEPERFNKDSISSFSIVKKNLAESIEKNDTVVTENGKIGIYKRKGIVKTEHGEIDCKDQLLRRHDISFDASNEEKDTVDEKPSYNVGDYLQSNETKDIYVVTEVNGDRIIADRLNDNGERFGESEEINEQDFKNYSLDSNDGFEH